MESHENPQLLWENIPRIAVKIKSLPFYPLWMSERTISAADVILGSLIHPVSGPSADTGGSKLCSVQSRDRKGSCLWDDAYSETCTIIPTFISVLVHK